MLTGGLIEFADIYPDRIEGMPLPKKPVDPNKKSTKELHKISSALSTTGPKSVKSVSTRKKDNSSDASSVMSSLSVADSVISKANVRKSRITTATNYR